MSTATPRNLALIACVSVGVVFVGSFLIGFYVLPNAQGGQARGWWEAMCRAAGFVRDVPTDLRRASAEFSSVVVPAAINHSGTAEQIGRGATLALQCTMCHGAAGLSAADSPNLAGQYSDVVYKQLIDYQRGSRANVVMTGLAETLSEENIVDLAYYYAYLPRTGSNASVESAPALVRVGDPIRNIAPCGSCHGNMQRKAGAPWLNGEPLVYLEDQLLAFHSDTRRNDVNAVMRSVAYRMTSQEITDLAHYYASLSP